MGIREICKSFGTIKTTFGNLKSKTNDFIGTLNPFNTYERLVLQKIPAKPRPKSQLHRMAERGNVFFTLFGAVAVVGVLGAGVMSTMRGPLSTMVEVNRREQAKAEVRLATGLVLVNADDGCSDSDGYTEADAPSGSGPTGGGALPSVGAPQSDPWGTPYGYCAWDHGPDAGTMDGCGTILAGNTSSNNIAVAIISAGPDRVFQTSCVADNNGTNDYVEPDAGGGDDIVVTQTYNEAVAGSGGLWDAVGADTASIDRDLDVTGGASFSGDVNLSSGSGALRLGAASLFLPDHTTLTDCNDANNGILRINNSTSTPALEVCDGTGGASGNWLSAGSVWSAGTGDDIYYDTGAAQVGIGMNNPDDVLDVVGSAQITGAVALDSTVDIGDLATLESLTVTNETTFNGSVTFNQPLTDDLIITGSTSDDTADALDVRNSGTTSIFTVQNDGKVGINNADPSFDLDVNGDTNTTGTYLIDGDTILASDDNVPGTLALGRDAGANIDMTTGGGVADNNTILGANAAATLTTGTDNIVIGQGVDIANANSQLNIGNALTGDLLTGNITVAGDLTVSGNNIALGTNTDTHILVNNGTAFGSVAMSGDATIANDGTLTIEDDAITEDKILNAAVTSAKIATTTTPGDNQCLKYIGGNMKWEVCSGSGGGDGVGSGDIEDVLTNGDDANGLNIVNVGKIGIADPTPDGTLLLDVNGQIGATEYCDADGANCTTAADIGILASLSCGNGQVAAWDASGSEWVCADAGISSTYAFGGATTAAAAAVGTTPTVMAAAQYLDEGGNYDGSAYTVPVDGTYYFNAHASGSMSTSGSWFMVIYVNGSPSGLTSVQAMNTAGGFNTSTVAGTLDLTAADVVDVRIYTNTNTVTPARTSFSGYKLTGGGAGTDTLTDLSCTDGQVAAWNDSGSAWECADAASSDTLSGLSCTDGQVAAWDNSGSAWVCADQTGGSGGGGTDVSFHVTKSANQTVTTTTRTVVTWDTETFDTNDDFASNRFTPTVAGKYAVTAAVHCPGSTSYCQVFIYKNGDVYAQDYDRDTAGQTQATTIVDMNGTTDYLEVQAVNAGGTAFGISTEALSYFTGTLIGGGGGSDTLAGLSCTDGQVAAWDNSGSEWVCADQTGGSGGGTDVSFSVTATTQSGGDPRVINFSTEDFDTASAFDPATERFTPTTAGKYIITLSAAGSGFATNGAFICSIYKNGASVADHNNRYPAGGTNLGCSTSVIVDMDGATDYIEGYILDSSGQLDSARLTGALISGGGSGGGGGSDTLSGLSCTDGQVAAWDNSGSEWVCADAASGGGGGGSAPTGGTITYDGLDVIHTFTADGTFNAGGVTNIELLMVGGGGAGAGASTNNRGGGGGGAGEYIYSSSLDITGNTDHTIVVGAGGAGVAGTAGESGEDSSAFGLTAQGGGGGARQADGLTGGSGGGAGNAATSGMTGGASTASDGIGNAGGNTTTTGAGGGAGGGGSAGAGSNNGGSGTASGGAGTSNSISGSATTYAAGGVGGNAAGGGGVPSSAAANTGDGGRGANGDQSADRAGGGGGSGVVIIRYSLLSLVGGGGGGSDTLSGLSCTDGQVAAWDNSGSEWVCADQTGGSGGGSGWGSYVQKAFNTEHTAATDGMVVAYIYDEDTDDNCSFAGYVDGTIIAYEFSNNATNQRMSISFPVPAGSTYQVYASPAPAGCSNTDRKAYFISGSGANDTLAGLSCTDGQVAAWDNSGSEWVCADAASSDTLSGLSCTDGQVAKWNNGGSAWECAADTDTDTDTLGGLSCSSGEIAKWNGAAWACAADSSGSDTLDSLSCSSGEIAKWNGAAWACAADTDTDTLGGLSCSSGEIAKWNGAAWACAADGSGSDTLDSLSCSSGEVAKWNGAAWACAADDDTANTDTLASLSCSDGQIAKWNNGGSAWECSADTGSDNLGNHTATTDLNMDSNDIININMLEFDAVAGDPPVSASGSLNGLSCTSGQVPKWNGSIWVCADDTLGTHTATEALDMATFDITNGGDFTATAYFHSSDARLKDNIETAKGLDLVSKLRGVTYDWKSDGSASAGVIAQEVETIFPRAVKTDGNGMKAVEYDQLIGPLIEAVKDLKAQNDALQKRIEELEGKE